jgi:hypothetical protein
MTIKSAPPTNPAPAEVVLHCANHPNVETSLRCATCDKPICAKCAKLTPTGYRCKECIQGIQKKYDTSEWYDYPVAFTIAGILGLLGGFLTGLIGFFIIFLAPIIGVIIAEIVRFATGRRRSLTLYKVAAVGAALGTLPFAAVTLFNIAFYGSWTYGFLNLLYQGVYAFTVTSTVYYRLRGISIR